MKIKILVVEDDHSIAEMYRFKLENEGYLVNVAHDGKEGLNTIEKFEPALILLDLKMPIMSGEEMLEKLRSKDKGSDIQVIILTNISKDEAPPILRFLNVDRYIVKAHYTPQQIVDIVKDVLG